MADRNMKNIQGLDYKVSVLAGSVTVATGTGGVTANAILGASVARTGTGAFRITLEDAWPELLACHIVVAKATAQDLNPQINAVTLASKQIDFRLLTGATPTDVTTEATTLYITMVFKNSTINP
jgi:hypothetical protein